MRSNVGVRVVVLGLLFPLIGAAAISGPIDASQIPFGRVTVNMTEISFGATAHYCFGEFMFGVPTDCSSLTLAPVSITISGNTGTNNWIITNSGSPIFPLSGDVISLLFFFDPFVNNQSVQPNDPFFADLHPPTLVSGPVPLSLHYDDFLYPFNPDPRPGPGEHWELFASWSPGSFTQGSTVVISAPLFLNVPEPSTMIYISLGVLLIVIFGRNGAGRRCVDRGQEN